MPDTGVCTHCGAGEDGEEVEVNEAGVCVDCEGEEGEDEDGMGPVDTGSEEEPE